MKVETSVAIMIVAADLDREKSSRAVTVGHHTATACATGLYFAQKIPDSHIVITAGDANHKWNCIWMALLMKDYIHRRDASMRVFVEKASVFTTNGEMQGLAYYVRARPAIKEIIVVVKLAQAPRAKYLCDYWFREYGITGVKVTYVPSSLKISLFQVLWELGAWPKNLWLRAIGKL